MDSTAEFRSFASDNNSGMCPEVLASLTTANRGHAIGYGDDPWTRRARDLMAAEFGRPDAVTYFVMNGTGANVFALSLAAGAGEAVLCSHCAHIEEDETAAPEAVIGCKVLPIADNFGKIDPSALRGALGVLGVIHHPQPACLSITQPTERGALYSIAEIKELADIAHGAGLVVHMDGARLAVAAVALGCGFRDFTCDAGVDIMSFGGMKNGVGFGEAVVIFKPELKRKAAYLHKARLQLDSKMRFISAQYEAYLSAGVWRRNALASLAAARNLAARLIEISGITLAKPVESNAVFARIPDEAAKKLLQKWFFYSMDKGIVRFVTSFDTSEADIEGIVSDLKAIMEGSQDRRFKAEAGLGPQA